MKLFFVCREKRQTKTISPFGQEGYHFKATVYLWCLSLPRRAVFFLPIVVSRWAKKEKPSVNSVALW